MQSRYRSQQFLSRRSLFAAALVGVLAAVLPAAAQSGSYPGMGAKLIAPEVYARSPHFAIRAALAGSERPTSLQLTEFLPPVDSQGQQGSCVGWATAYYNYTYLVAKKRKLNREQIESTKFQFSPAYIYNQKNEGIDQGMMINDAFNLLIQQGCATLQEMPYNDKDYRTAPNEAARTRARRYVAPKNAALFYTSPDPEKLKTFLSDAQQPFVMAIPIYDDFPNDSRPSDYVYRTDGNARLRGYHAITIIGYDDSKQAFRMVNSWGKSWGDNGFLWISESFLTRHGRDGWSVVPGGIRARGSVPRVTVVDAEK